MTNQEAIDIIKTAIAEVEWEYPMDYAAAFDMAVKALEKQDDHDTNAVEWISVKDRLPEEGVDVLVWETQGFAYCDMLKSGVWNIGADEGAIISHWMPLPEPPKGEKNNG